MIGKVFGGICLISFLFALFTGNISTLGNAALDGASGAVSLTFSLMGMMCLWGGIMRVAEKSGVVDGLSKLMSPLLRFLFPDAYRKKKGLGEVSASISANIFGIGNAATPLAISAMEALQENNEDKSAASDDMIMFTVLSTASFDIIPTTLIALRRAAQSADPFEIIVPVWLCSFFSSCVAVMLVKGFSVIKKSSGRKKLNRGG